MKKEILIIPAAGKATRMMPLSSSMSKAMIPVAGQPILSHIIESTKDYVDSVVVVTGRLTDIDNFLDKKKYKNVTSIEQYPDMNGPLGAIYTGIHSLPLDVIENSNITIWLGDTLINNPDDIKDIFNKSGKNSMYLGAATVPDWSRWCMYSERTNKLYDKPERQPPTDKALIGIYRFTNLEPKSMFNNILDVIDNIAYDNENYENYSELEISKLLDEYSNIKPKCPVSLIDLTESWTDCGDLPSLYSANSKMISNGARAHNNIRIEDGIVYKKSSNHNFEVKWYEAFDKNMKLRSLIPQYYGECGKYGEEYAIELCSGHTLQELVLYHNINRKDVWKTIIDTVLNRMYNMHTNTNGQDPRTINNSSSYNYNMFLENISNRFMDAHQSGLFTDEEYGLFLDLLNESYNKIYSGTFRWPHIPSDALFPTQSMYTHGDLHFANIFFDAATNKVKFIDPRGGYDYRATTMGNPLYDLAKFYQSVIGHYCHISSDEEISDNDIKIYDMLEELINEKLLELGESPEEIKLAQNYSILLLLSAIPCHYDNPERQERMKQRALTLIAN